MDLRQGLRHGRIAFDMEIDEIRTGIGKRFDKTVGMLHHQMNVEKHITLFS